MALTDAKIPAVKPVENLINLPTAATCFCSFTLTVPATGDSVIGYRAMACSSLIESGLWSRDAVERQRSHQERNDVRADYIHKAEFLDERRLILAIILLYQKALKIAPRYKDCADAT